MGSILHEIGQGTQKRIDALKEHEALDLLKEKASHVQYKAQNFALAFEERQGFNIIAEYKRASPSQGDIAPELKVLDVVSDYLENGAKALSILTEPAYFRGDQAFIGEVRAKYPSAKILMKDFFVDEYQLYQAKISGADCILLIVGLLDDKLMYELYQKALSLGLSVLVEVHNLEELQRAIPLDQAILGINNRDLRDLSIDLNTTRTLMESVPDGRIVISESGIKTTDDLKDLSAFGVHGFLVGTGLMATKQPGKALARLLGTSC